MVEKNNRHAYLIMAHHKINILEELLIDLDDPRNDIFLHIDKKAKDININRLYKFIKRANLILVPRKNVHWGGYTQIQCILNLMERASTYGYHSYYHFMVGVEYPLKSQDEIYDFFDSHRGKEFIGFDKYDTHYLDRIRYYHVFNECGRPWDIVSKKKNEIRYRLVCLQQKRNVNLLKHTNVEFKKGNACWSLTHNFVKYALSQKKFIKKYFRHSYCGDEIFIHTILFNSIFRKNIYDLDDEYHSCMRMTTWTDPHNQYHLYDLKELMNSERLFARKFDGEDGLQTILLIKAERDNKQKYGNV
ncbi:beta-1,6-N-acetylglucosaminyltransferase [Butyrivibrio sp. INlla16]|uniref:beta-1,6-N-acetylglucosaminyltransferase n=1 Tax=Butyrivibrio sp. INlla16 TaxID=1520807 RepID=UPI00088D1024|nr:beta-1,6-N-acetylglucosaminyltransferase [Butyrivibrio sp. INlla16]SDB68219.1 Core-2/I-Branching enzyme [Butyrivibrio sp. INlla16]